MAHFNRRVTMRILSVIAVVMLVSCAEQPSAMSESESVVDHSRWFLGTWDCPLQNFGNVPPYGFHKTHGVLSFVEEASTGGVRATWDEVVDSEFESFKALGFVAEMSVGSDDENGIALVSARLTESDGTVEDTTGTSQGSFKECSTCLGRVDLNGIITFPDGTQRTWGALFFGLNPNLMTWSRRIGIGGSTQQQYFSTGVLFEPTFHVANCIRR